MLSKYFGLALGDFSMGYARISIILKRLSWACYYKTIRLYET